MSRVIDIRAGDGRPFIAAFAALVGISVAYAILETARDTLFLSQLPASLLPWAYLGIAALVLLLSRLARWGRLRDQRAILALFLFVAAGGTAFFFPLAALTGSAIPIALYLWAGVISTLLYPRFWLLLSLVLSPGQAKRLYPLVGAGALVGAALGSLAADRLLHVMPPRGLLLVAAAVLAGTALVVPILGKAAGKDEPSAPDGRVGQGARMMASHIYLRRIFLLTLVTMTTVTIVDFVFKSAVAANVAPDHLGRFLAKTYAVLSGVALLVQLAVAPWLVARFGVVAALVALPIALVGGGVAYLVTGALWPVLVLKLADGALRNSLSRVGAELLLLPLAAPVRERVKPVIETAGTRGGQAVAAFIILGALALGASALHLDAVALGLAVLWLVAIFGLRELYLGIYRAALREGRLRLAPLSRPDLRTIETLVTALSSVHDLEVVAAMELLVRAGKAQLIPAPMVYHPSMAVVQRALELLASAGRSTEIGAMSERLFGHVDPAIRALGALYAPRERVEAALDDASVLVRAAATVALLGDEPEHERSLGVAEALLRDASAEGPRALARAIADHPSPQLLPLLLEIAADPRPGVAAEVARAALAMPSLELLPRLIEILADRDARLPARRAIRAIGSRALGELEAALRDSDRPRAVRRSLARTISQFASAEAASILIRALDSEPDGAVLYRILRELTRLKGTSPELLGAIDKRSLEDLADGTQRRVVDVIGWRVALETGHRPATAARTLVLRLLAEKERHTLERVFLILGLIDPRAGYELVYTGLRSKDGRRRDAALEIIGNVLEPPRRELLLNLVDDLPDVERLRRASAPVPSLADALAAMAADHSPALRALVEYMVETERERSAS